MSLTILSSCWGLDMAPIQKQNYWAFGLFCYPPIWWGSPYPTFSVTHKSSLTGQRDRLLSPHQNFFTGAEKLKSFFLDFWICRSSTSTKNTIGLLTISLKLLSHFLRVLVVSLNLWRIIWSLKIHFSSFELGQGSLLLLLIVDMLLIERPLSDCWSIPLVLGRWGWRDRLHTWWDSTSDGILYTFVLPFLLAASRGVLRPYELYIYEM